MYFLIATVALHVLNSCCVNRWPHADHACVVSKYSWWLYHIYRTYGGGPVLFEW
jgi:hypothetical protein